MNIYLTGMMGCGKTTLGALLAEHTGTEFLDMDAQIVKKAGKSIPQIFAESGEDGFREIETRVLSEIAERDGLVVACGGGVILLERNVKLMKQSGKIYFIDRAPEESSGAWICPAGRFCGTEKRPFGRSIKNACPSIGRRQTLFSKTREIPATRRRR